MDNSTIIKMLNDNGETVISLAKKLDVTRGAVYQAIDGTGSRRIRIAIAIKLNTKPTDLWPWNYEVRHVDDAVYIISLKRYSWEQHVGGENA